MRWLWIDIAIDHDALVPQCRFEFIRFSRWRYRCRTCGRLVRLTRWVDPAIIHADCRLIRHAQTRWISRAAYKLLTRVMLGDAIALAARTIALDAMLDGLYDRPRDEQGRRTDACGCKWRHLWLTNWQMRTAQRAAWVLDTWHVRNIGVRARLVAGLLRLPLL